MRTTSFSVTRLSLGLAIAGLTLVGCSREEARGRLRERAKSYAKALANDILR